MLLSLNHRFHTTICSRIRGIVPVSVQPVAFGVHLLAAVMMATVRKLRQERAASALPVV
jgi:hypothetical protein